MKYKILLIALLPVFRFRRLAKAISQVSGFTISYSSVKFSHRQHHEDGLRTKTCLQVGACGS